MESGAFRDAAMRAGLVALCLAVSPSPLSAQAVKIGSREIQIHGSVQQGVAVTDDNNFLTMMTSQGSAGMTDAALGTKGAIGYVSAAADRAGAKRIHIK
jgi:hypothetical protein